MEEELQKEEVDELAMTASESVDETKGTSGETNTPSDEGKKSRRAKRSDIIFYTVMAVLFVTIIGLRLWVSNAFGRVEVSGTSMCQTLQDGDILTMNLIKDGKGLERGDIIVINVSEYDLKDSKGNAINFLIKRLIAVEGDKVKCTDGQISICYAGTEEYVLLDEPYAYYGGWAGKDQTDYDFREYTVGEGEIFFLGDNRLNSVDSRYQEFGGSHLNGKLYKATDVQGVVSQWAVDNKAFFDILFFWWK